MAWRGMGLCFGILRALEDTLLCQMAPRIIPEGHFRISGRWLPNGSQEHPKGNFERLTHGAFALGGPVRTVLAPLELELPRFAGSSGFSAFGA